jgi:hypothetical protein
MKKVKVLATVAALASTLAIGGSAVLGNAGSGNPPENRGPTTSPAEKASKSGVSSGRSGEAPGRIRPVIVTYMFKGTITEKDGTNSFVFDPVTGNSHARRLMTQAEMSMAGTDTLSVQTGPGTRFIRGGTASSEETLSVNDTVVVKYRARFRAKAKESVVTFGIADLQELAPKTVISRAGS